MSTLWALSDLHVNHKGNREALQALPDYPDDWLIIGGDVAESAKHLTWTLDTLAPKFAKLLWVPGNHELWGTQGLAGVDKYASLVEVCRQRGVLTPEDPWVHFDGVTIALLFLLYDYSFAPDGLTRAEIIERAKEAHCLCADEFHLKPHPFGGIDEWCADRLRISRDRLDTVDGPTILVNHWPLRRDLVRLFRIPRFTPWCGTRKTEDWHVRYQAKVVVSGHLHMRATDWRDGVRFEEVSLGYPRHWNTDKGAAHYLRKIWPGPVDGPKLGGPEWHR